MNNLIIVGNGFDLAHGLKTSYTDFVKYIIDSKATEGDSFSDLYDYNTEILDYNQFMLKVKSTRLNPSSIFNWKNHLFYRIVSDVTSKSWCDIEQLYFKELVLKESYEEPKKLNDDFEIIKKHLQDYIFMEEQNNFQKLRSYSLFFEELTKSSNNLILNFNYTNTVKGYLKTTSNLVCIHGEINNGLNPIIFGYAADHTQSRQLVDEMNSEFLRNIKKHCYKRTNNFNRLSDYLSKTHDIDVFILGHSCGISDNLILNEILNNENVRTITVLYFENYENYFQTQVNIDRIMNNDSNFKKVVNFQDSIRMPQASDDNQLIEKFYNYIRLRSELKKGALSRIE